MNVPLLAMIGNPERRRYSLYRLAAAGPYGYLPTQVLR